MLSLCVPSFPEMSKPEFAVRIDHVLGGPVAVVEAAPGGVVVVLDDQPLQVILNGGVFDLFDVFLKLEFWCVYA